ncbi:hypothetical protein [Methylobacterium sp. A54F]
MAVMSAREFVDTIAVPTVREFMEDPTQRRGYLACIVSFHVGDYLAPGHEPTRDLQRQMAKDLGRPFMALQRMCNAAKHSESTSKGVLLMQSGSDTARPPSGFGSPWGEFRLDDHRGGRYVEDEGQRYDMLDLCLIVLRKFAELYPTELAGSAIEGIRYSTKDYAR